MSLPIDSKLCYILMDGLVGIAHMTISERIHPGKIVLKVRVTVSTCTGALGCEFQSHFVVGLYLQGRRMQPRSVLRFGVGAIISLLMLSSSALGSKWTDDVFITEDSLLTRTVKQLVATVNDLKNDVDMQKSNHQMIRDIIQNCLDCDVPPPLPVYRAPTTTPSSIGYGLSNLNSNRRTSGTFTPVPVQQGGCASFPPPCYQGVTCTEDSAGRAVCGQCPRGTTGDGRRCRAMITCQDRPCFVGVRCEDTPT
ncbi:unnamed protein product, partial [Allacma fusca]